MFGVPSRSTGAVMIFMFVWVGDSICVFFPALYVFLPPARIDLKKKN